MLDPNGYYRALGVRPDASAPAIHQAFRALAKRLHPDVPATGDPAAFLRIKEAYETLGNAVRRGAYDRAARTAEMEATADWRPGQPWPGASGSAETAFGWPPPETRAAPPNPPDLETAMGPLPEPKRPHFAWVRWPLLLWAVAVLLVVGAVVGGVRQFRSLRPSAVTSVQAMQRNALPEPAPAENPGPSDPTALGEPHFVQPVGAGLTLWRYDQGASRYTPDGRLAPFTPVALLRLVARNTLAELRLPDGSLGYVYPGSLMPGDAAAAKRSRCIYDAGPTPQNGERLDPADPTTAPRAGERPGPVTVRNDGASPAVFVLRVGAAHLATYVVPRGRLVLTRVPDVPWVAAFATGDLWSRACGRFMAGMQARVLPGQLKAEYVLPGEAGRDLGEDAFAGILR